jgi:hypothetical protein
VLEIDGILWNFVMYGTASKPGLVGLASLDQTPKKKHSKKQPEK